MKYIQLDLSVMILNQYIVINLELIHISKFIAKMENTMLNKATMEFTK